MRYDNKSEIETWLTDIQRRDYSLGGEVIDGKKLRSKIEEILDERRPEVFIPDALVDLALTELSPKYLESLCNFRNLRFNSD
ncbi:MAG: hypothetical protein AABX83_02080 [Nanoarchaeota archaeon]